MNLDIMREWSPAKEGKPFNEKKLNDFVNILNLNPDRHISAVISKSDEPNALNLGYDLYEISPWHFYIQLDNAGSRERQWSPRFGFINTNVTGRDDRITLVYQAKVDDIENNYAGFGSYEVPLFTPQLRLNLFAGYSEYDTNPANSGPFSYLGNGLFGGGKLTLNVLQFDDWFLDLNTSVTYEKSRSSSIFTGISAGTSDIRTTTWGQGVELYKTDDMTDTYVGLHRFQSIDGSSSSAFTDSRNGGADDDYAIYQFNASRSQYLDDYKIQRGIANFRWIDSTERLTPLKMTTFGGLYTVRGYKEESVVADGGLIANFQYEYDLVKLDESKNPQSYDPEHKPFIQKFAPLVFFDFARAENKHPIAAEERIEELASVGTGVAVTLGDNFEGAVYYGLPLRGAGDTTKNRGRWSFAFLLKW